MFSHVKYRQYLKFYMLIQKHFLRACNNCFLAFFKTPIKLLALLCINRSSSFHNVFCLLPYPLKRHWLILQVWIIPKLKLNPATPPGNMVLHQPSDRYRPPTGEIDDPITLRMPGNQDNPSRTSPTG